MNQPGISKIAILPIVTFFGIAVIASSFGYLYAFHDVEQVLAGFILGGAIEIGWLCWIACGPQGERRYDQPTLRRFLLGIAYFIWPIPLGFPVWAVRLLIF